MKTIIDEMREARFNKIKHQTLQQRRANISRPISIKTLDLMETIVQADIDYDRKHRICYGPGVVRRIINRLRRAA